MLIQDKNEGWLITCDDCESGQVRNHGASYLSDTGDCPTCDGAGHWQADAGDFDGLVILNTGETVTVEAGMFWSLEGDKLCEVVIDDIAAVLECVT